MEHMRIETVEENGYCHIALDGDLDASSAILLDEQIDKAIKGEESKILVDCERLNYISSAGLGVFMSHLNDLEASGKSLVLFGLSDKVRKVFEILGLHELLKIAKDKEEAISIS